MWGKILPLLMIAATAVSTSHAADAWHSGKLTKVYSLADGSFVISFDSDAPSCSNTNQPMCDYVRPDEKGMTPEGVRNLLSSSLAAAVQGKPVSINFDNATQHCYVNRLAVSY